MTQLPLSSSPPVLHHLPIEEGCYFNDEGEAARARREGFNPPEPKPDEPGCYRVMNPIPQIPAGSPLYAWWSGEFWGRCMASQAAAIAQKDVRARFQRKAWREVGAR